MRSAALLAVMLSMPAHAAAQVAAVAGSPVSGTGLIAGQVVDATTGAPIPEAIVRMNSARTAQELATAPNGRVMADVEGRFFFADLPPRDYYLEASKGGYAPGGYGQRRAWSASLRLPLGEGERQSGIVLRVWKYSVISGTVVDEAGEPVVGVAVRALAKNVMAGRTQYGNAEVISELVPTSITDDRGMFRLAQLSPGTYIVVVPSSQTSLPAGMSDAQLAAFRSELFFSGVTELATPGHPRAQQIGDTALLSAAAVMIPPPPSPSGRMEIYKTTYFPAAATVSGASEITVAAGEERGDITIGLKPVPSMRVSGRLVTVDNTPPPPTTLRLIGESAAGVVSSDLTEAGRVGFETVSGMSDASGRFTLLGVPPGEYILRHGSRFIARAWEQGDAAYWISQPVTVGKQDVTDLVVELRPALRVEGRIEFRSGGRVVPAPAVMRNPLVVFETPFGEPGRFVASGRDGEFATVAAGGQYFVRPYDRSGWFVQSITAGEKDVTDKLFDLRSDTTSFVVTYSDKPSVVSGSVSVESGTGAGTAMVLAFPTDTKQWRGYGASPRNLKSAITTPAGGFKFEHLPPGSYYIVAIDAGEADDWMNPATLEALAKQATTVTITAGDSPRALDLRVKTIR